MERWCCSCEELISVEVRGRPKKYLGEVIRWAVAQFQLTKNMAFDRGLWRAHMRVVG